jgi:hypothetical protein
MTIVTLPALALRVGEVKARPPLGSAESFTVAPEAEVAAAVVVVLVFAAGAP